MRVTRQRSQQLGISHLFLPDHCENVFHALGSPEEVEDAEVHEHAVVGEDCANVTGDMILQTEYIPPGVTRRHLPITQSMNE